MVVGWMGRMAHTHILHTPKIREKEKEINKSSHGCSLFFQDCLRKGTAEVLSLQRAPSCMVLQTRANYTLRTKDSPVSASFVYHNNLARIITLLSFLLFFFFVSSFFLFEASPSVLFTDVTSIASSRCSFCLMTRLKHRLFHLL